MDLEILHDKTIILNFLKENPGLHIYSIGDLDDFYWSKTTWYALRKGNIIQSIALLYAGSDTPTLLLFYENESYYSIQLLERIRDILPEKFYAHLSPGLIEVFNKKNIIDLYGVHYKMVLKKVAQEPDDSNISKLTVSDLSAIRDFYSVS